MDQQTICLKSIYELRLDPTGQPIRYRIPAYQRGFRWTSQQVTQLLEDIRDFTRRENPQPDDFYCLQPLVLRPGGAWFDVVDGQQRLTTLLLILRYFNKRLEEPFRTPLYTLEYETRPNLIDFLKNPSAERASTNVDFFHMYQAVKTIETWFAGRQNEVREIESAFLNKAKVIWYQLSPAENAVQAFARLNVGKIPLTNGELIRALFLKRSSANEEGDSFSFKIAYEWDLLEKGLQDDEFWYFMSNQGGQSANRINFLFNLAARSDRMKESPDAYATFYHYNAKLGEKDADPEGVWLDVKRTYMLLEEWFKDRRLFHLVGFLIWSGMDINQLRVLARGVTKSQFRENIRLKVFERTIGASGLSGQAGTTLGERITDYIDRLEYGRHSRQIRSILLLFNLATLLQKPESNIRFQFDSFKTASWDIEHVRSVVMDRPGSRKLQIEWLERCQGYLQFTGDHEELQTEIQVFMGLPPSSATDAAFDPVYAKVLQAFHENNDDGEHAISNLVLLDAATNRSYKNAVFAVKRHRILSLDRDGVFVPLCTRNVFLKCYSPKVEHVVFWTEADMDGYRTAMIDMLCDFFKGGWIHD